MSALLPIAIKVHSAESGEIDRFLGDRIYEFNASATSRNDGELFAATRRDAAGSIVAGISGYTWAGCWLRQAEITDHPVGHSSIVFAKRLAECRANGK